MHESKLMHDLIHQLKNVLEVEKAKKITAIEVKLGALSHFSEEHFREHFEVAASGTPVEGAQLTVNLGNDLNDPNAQEVIIESVEIQD